MSAFSLICYKIVQNNVSANTTQGNISINADKINSKGSISSSSKNNFMPENILKFNNSNNYQDKITYNISTLDVEQLKLYYALQGIMLYLLVLVFLVMKALSDKNLKSNFIEKLPITDFLKNIFTKILKLWGKTSIVWVYILLVTVIFGLAISIWTLHIILTLLS